MMVLHLTNAEEPPRPEPRVLGTTVSSGALRPLAKFFAEMWDGKYTPADVMPAMELAGLAEWIIDPDGYGEFVLTVAGRAAIEAAKG